MNAQTYVPVEHLWNFTKPAAHEQRLGNPISAAGNAVWLLHPESGLLKRTKQVLRSAGQRQEKTVVEELALPPELASQDLRRLDLTITAVSETNAWLIDHDGRRLWRRDATRWLGPWPLGEPVGTSAAGGAGELIVNTPGHSMYAFAVIRPDGTVARRFGSRLQPWRFGLDEDWNRWVVAVLSDGTIIAAHRYSDRLRAYDAQLELAWERAAEFPTVEQLRAAAGDAEASIRVDPATCCYTAKLVKFASRVVPISAKHYAVQFGEVPAIEEFDHAGKWTSTLPVRLDSDKDTRLLGLTAAGEDLLIVAAGGVVRAKRVPDQRLVEGKVVDENQRPVAKAAVEMVSAAAAKFKTTTDEAGRFSVVVANKADWHHVTISAAGFRTWNRRGSLQTLVGRPIVLSRPLAQCVRVSDAATGEPIRQFEIEILRESADHKSVSRTSGARASFSTSDGTACLESPWEHPWTVKVSSEGYAAKKVAVEEGLQLEVALDAEAVLEVSVEEPSGSPVPQATLRLTDVADAQKPVVMVEDETQSVTNEGGFASLEGLAVGTYRLEVTSDTFLPFTENVTLEVGVNRKRVEVKRGSTLLVRVVSREAAKELEGVVVLAELLSGSTGRLLECTTGPDGRCSIAGLSPGRYHARARAHGLVEAQRPFQIAPEAGDVEVELRLESSVRVTGHVEGIAHYPNLDLEVMGSKPGVPFLVAPVDAQGRFAFEEFPSGDTNVRVRERDRNSTLVYQRVTIPSGRRTHHIVLRLPEAILLQGSIRFHDSGCGACSLTIQGLGSGVDRFDLQVKVEATGEYTARIPGKGLYVAQATAPDGAMDRRVLEIAGPTREDFDFDDAERTTVVVLDSRRSPVESARVVAIDSRGVSLADVTTDARGNASLPRLNGTTRIIASKEGTLATYVHPGRDGPSRVEIVLRASAQLELDLRDARTGGPVYRAHVRVRSARSGLDLGAQLVSRSDEQPFTISIEPGDVVDLVIKAPGYAFKTVYGLAGGSGAQRIGLTGRTDAGHPSQ